jgi:UDP-GlcNAc:undecaprenyl-phosphate GlcNAc-1-phosphate transferase
MGTLISKNSLLLLAAIAGATFAFSLLSVFAVRALAHRVGFVAKPRAERWHRKPTALAGGVGIYAAFLAGTLIGGGTLPWLLVGASAMFVLGFVDDVVHMKPYAKLIGQVVIAALAVVAGPVLPWTSVAIVNQAISFFWIIGITNALNLLDNMDGLAAGIACVAALFQAIFFLIQHQQAEAACAAALFSALLGFLVFNWNPASIFMGDCGALFLGYVLASLAMRSSYGRSRELLATIAVPVLVMLVPIFDTTFVTLTRILRGRPVSQGGRDHTSHRLVTLGMSERTAVSTLIGIGLTGGTVAVLARVGMRSGVWVGAPLIAVALVFLGIHLARTDQPAEVPDRVNLLSSLTAFGYRRRVFEVLLDAVLAMVAFLTAFLLRFDGAIPAPVQQSVARVFIVVVATKLTALYLMRAYDGLWRYAGIRDLLLLGRAAVSGSAAVIVIVGLWLRFDALSRGALVIDGLVFAALLTASRVSFRLLRVLIAPPAAAPDSGSTRVLLWGAGDLGVQIARALSEHLSEGLTPIGFVDDDPKKKGRLVNGLRVHGDCGAIAGLLDSGAANLVVVTSLRISAERIAAVVATVGASRVRRMRLMLEEVHPVRALPAAE